MSAEYLLRVKEFNLLLADDQTEIALLKEINFALKPGESLSIIGESGSGKSLLCKALLGLLPSRARFSGSILLNHEQEWDILQSKRSVLRYLRRHKMALLFQDASAALNPLLRCGQQVYNCIDDGKTESAAQRKARVMTLLDHVSLSDPERIYGSYPYQLSGGEKQRVALAIALAGQPQLLIADEPTTALDVITGKRILRELQKLKMRYGYALILVTHDLPSAFHFAEKIAVMYAGKIVEWGDSRIVENNPVHPYTAALLAIQRSFKKDKQPLTIPGDIPAMTALPSGCPFHPRCKYATAQCQQSKPPPIELKNGTRVRCFYPLGE